MSLLLSQLLTPSRRYGEAVTSWTDKSGACCPERNFLTWTQPSPSIRPRTKSAEYMSGMVGQPIVRLFLSVKPMERRKSHTFFDVKWIRRCAPLFLSAYLPSVKESTRSINWKSLDEMSMVFPERQPSLHINPINQANSPDQFSKKDSFKFDFGRDWTRPAAFLRLAIVRLLIGCPSGIVTLAIIILYHISQLCQNTRKD